MQRTRVQVRILLTVVFGVIAVLFVLLGLSVSVVALLVAIPFLLAAVILGHQTLRESEVGYRDHAERETRGGRSTRRRQAHSARSKTRQRQATAPAGRLTKAEARAVLEVPPDASESALQRAYREQLKEVHPDQGGDEEEFQRVTKAYDRLSVDESTPWK